MRKSICIAFSLSVVVEANFLTAAVRGMEPIILSVGTVFAALGLDVKPKHDLPLFLPKDKNENITLEEEVK